MRKLLAILLSLLCSLNVWGVTAASDLNFQAVKGEGNSFSISAEWFDGTTAFSGSDGSYSTVTSSKVLSSAFLNNMATLLTWSMSGNIGTPITLEITITQLHYDNGKPVNKYDLIPCWYVFSFNKTVVSGSAVPPSGSPLSDTYPTDSVSKKLDKAGTGGTSKPKFGTISWSNTYTLTPSNMAKNWTRSGEIALEIYARNAGPNTYTGDIIFTITGS